MFKKLLIAILALSCVAAQADRRISINGKKETVVTTAQIRLADIADVYSSSIEDDEAVIALKKIVIDRSPVPGKQINISGLQVVDALRANQVSLDKVGYR